MKSIFILLTAVFCLFYSKGLAIEYQPVEVNTEVVYSPVLNAWSSSDSNTDSVVFTRNMQSQTGSYSFYTYGDKELKLSSDFEFIFNLRLIGVDNEKFKFYETIYKECKFEEKLLSYEQVQEIFSDVDVIKLSDFNKDTYTILSNNEPKTILIYNDTEFNFRSYFVKPNECAADKNIKPLINLPKKGKVTISHITNGKDKEFIIKVK